MPVAIPSCTKKKVAQYTKNGEFGFQVDKCHLGWVKLKVSERGESKNE